MKLKVLYQYEEIIDDVEKIVPSEDGRVEIFTKDGLHCIPNHWILEIEVIKDAK